MHIFILEKEGQSRIRVLNVLFSCFFFFLTMKTLFGEPGGLDSDNLISFEFVGVLFPLPEVFYYSASETTRTYN